MEIGYFPKKYYNNTPNAGGFFPFLLDNQTKYVINFETDLKYTNEEWLFHWMNKMKLFPLYFCLEVPNSWTYELNLKHNEIINSVETSDSIVYKFKIATLEQFLDHFSFCIELACNGENVLWSNRDVFSLESMTWFGNIKGQLKEAIVVDLQEKNSVLFWINYDADSFVLITNDELYSNYNFIIDNLPESFTPEFAEYV